MNSFNMGKQTQRVRRIKLHIDSLVALNSSFENSDTPDNLSILPPHILSLLDVLPTFALPSLEGYLPWCNLKKVKTFAAAEPGSFMPITHVLAFNFASSGMRGSRYIWKLAYFAERKPLAGSLVVLPDGFPLAVDENDWISRTIYEGTYERPLLQFLDSLRISETVIDVGANIGVTLWHALYGKDTNSSFLAFEPSRQCVQSLRMVSTKLDVEGRIYNLALGETNEVRTIYGLGNQLHSGLASLIPNTNSEGTQEAVQVRNLDSILQEHTAQGGISLLKIDTEGYEEFVIRGSERIFSSGLIGVFVIEVSPEFGEVVYLDNVDRCLGPEYLWFVLEAKGILKSRPYLRRIFLPQAKAMKRQWNLIILRKDALNECIETNPNFFE